METSATTASCVPALHTDCAILSNAVEKNILPATKPIETLEQVLLRVRLFLGSTPPWTETVKKVGAIIARLKVEAIMERAQAEAYERWNAPHVRHEKNLRRKRNQKEKADTNRENSGKGLTKSGGAQQGQKKGGKGKKGKKG